MERLDAREESRDGAPARTVVVEVRDLGKTYAETLAVDGLSFQLEAGEILGLLGPNGAGKTTTLRSIAGILPFDRGRIRIAGFDVARAPIEAKRRLAHVPDDPKLFDNLTCREHIEFVARVYGLRDYRPRAETLLERFELVEQRDKLGSELSRGMRQKLASVCAFLHEPDLLLLDEPMTGLDPRGIRTLGQLILESKGRGAAVIISSHLLSMVERLCTSILVLHRGRCLLQGTIDSVRAKFPELSRDASLEDLFFHATETSAPTASATPAPRPGDRPA